MRRIIALLTLLFSAFEVGAHPGHPAMGLTHAHVFGVDPMWLVVAGAVVVTGAVLIVRRGGARSRVLK
ncbi:MAG: hypothetical protein ACJ8LN_01135 [Sulfurifustis sp.]